MSKEADFLTIKENGQHELVIKKSRFIATLARVEDEEEARVLYCRDQQKVP